MVGASATTREERPAAGVASGVAKIVAVLLSC
jgi:hypothetical protein